MIQHMLKQCYGIIGTLNSTLVLSFGCPQQIPQAGSYCAVIPPPLAGTYSEYGKGRSGSVMIWKPLVNANPQIYMFPSVLNKSVLSPGVALLSSATLYRRKTESASM